MFDREIFQHLKNGRLLYVQQSGLLSALGKPMAEGFESFIKKFNPGSIHPVLLLPELGQISIFLKEVPEIAWDIMAYSEKVLEVIFSGGRNVPKHFFALGEGDKIAIRVESKGAFHKMLYNMGSPLILVRLPISDGKLDLSPYDKMLNLPDDFEWKLKPDKVLMLEVNGGIRFLE